MNHRSSYEQESGLNRDVALAGTSGLEGGREIHLLCSTG